MFQIENTTHLLGLDLGSDNSYTHYTESNVKTGISRGNIR